MTLTFLSDQRPFKVAQTIVLEKDIEFKPATDMRQVQDQNKNTFFATVDDENWMRGKLYKFTRTNRQWSDKPLKIGLKEHKATSCLIIPSGCVLVMMHQSFSFYSPELEQVKEGAVTDLVDGLYACCQFKPLKNSQSGTCITLNAVSDVKKLETHNI